MKKIKIAELSVKLKRDRTIRGLMDSIMEKFGTMGKRLRSLSPRKKGKAKELVQDEY